MLSSVTAPWVQDLDLQINSISDLKCKFTLNYSEKLVRAGNIICGQAIVSAADTAMIVAVMSAIGKYQEITTVDISCKYLRSGSPSINKVSDDASSLKFFEK